MVDGKKLNKDAGGRVKNIKLHKTGVKCIGGKWDLELGRGQNFKKCIGSLANSFLIYI